MLSYGCRLMGCDGFHRGWIKLVLVSVRLIKLVLIKVQLIKLIKTNEQKTLFAVCLKIVKLMSAHEHLLIEYDVLRPAR